MPDALPAHLQADCAACVALCCVGPAFDAVQGFGYDKPAHQPCRHLCASSACAIHAERAARGFTSCEVFDCQGAGQRVTALFGGTSWRDGPGVAARMFDAYARMCSLHELLVLLSAAQQRARGAQAAATVAALAERVEAACAATPEVLLLCDPAVLRREVLDGLRAVRADLA